MILPSDCVLVASDRLAAQYCENQLSARIGNSRKDATMGRVLGGESLTLRSPRIVPGVCTENDASGPDFRPRWHEIQHSFLFQKKEMTLTY